MPTPSPFNFNITLSPEWKRTHVTIGGESWELSPDGTQVRWRDLRHGGFGAEGEYRWVPRENLDSVYNIEKARKEVDAKWSAEKIKSGEGAAQMAADMAQRTGGWQSLLNRQDTAAQVTPDTTVRNTLLGSPSAGSALGSNTTLGTPSPTDTPAAGKPADANRNTLLGQLTELGQSMKLGADPIGVKANPLDKTPAAAFSTPKNLLEINNNTQLPKTAEEAILFLKKNTLLGGKK